MRSKTFFSEQARRPSGLFGRVVMSKIFDLGNAPLNGFMKELLIFNIYSKIEVKDLLLRNGFSGKIDIHSRKIKSNKYHCCIAVK